VIYIGFLGGDYFGTYIEFKLFNKNVRVIQMEFLELIVVFWVSVFFISGSHLVLKSYKRKKETIKISNF
jgi:hypothetical protein